MSEADATGLLSRLIQALPTEMKLHIMRFLPFEKVHWAVRDIPFFRNDWFAVHGVRGEDPETTVMKRLTSLACVLVVREGERLHRREHEPITLEPGVYRMKRFIQETNMSVPYSFILPTVYFVGKTYDCLLQRTDDAGADSEDGRTSCREEHASAVGDEIDLVDGYRDGALLFRRMDVRRRTEFVLRPGAPYLTVSLGVFGSQWEHNMPDAELLAYLDEDFRCFGFAFSWRGDTLSDPVWVSGLEDGYIHFGSVSHEVEMYSNYKWLEENTELRQETYGEYRRGLSDFICRSLRPEIGRHPRQTFYSTPKPGPMTKYMETRIVHIPVAPCKCLVE